MSSNQLFRFAGYSAYISAAAMIMSIALTIIVTSQGEITSGSRTHSPLVEAFDVLAALFLIPLPTALHHLYRSTALTLSRLTMLIGVVVGVAGTIVNTLFVFEVLWFVDVLSGFLFGLLLFCLWMLLEAFLARQSGKPPGGFVMALIGATIIGYPLWAIWLGRYFLSGEFSS